ncbi:hypothetical protein FRC12_010650 [Ceratobasidium sp. 428]|nr:hypothetical protein FRC12_010650 [Ceratobasidium sp. 428]
MTAFPRAIFSNKELDVVRWFTEKCSVPNMPANSTVESRFKDIMKLLGLESQLKQSKLENYFAVSSIGTIVANELANPLVRERMVFYAQDEGATVRQAANGKRWMEEVDASLAAPMVRKDLPVGHQDYFVHEPFLASLEIDGQLVPRPLLPIRFFERSGSLFARSHPLLSSDAGYTIDGDIHIDVPVSSFLLPFPEFCQEYERYELPCPESIIGVRSSTGHRPWSEPTENPWRSRANGRIVRSVPVWLYCDDTSGNQSKKWNKHNSFLFTLAGLPREYSQNPYNVHFLSTSNIATPLEMLEAITEELSEIQSTGVTAFDCKTGEDILAIPWVYAMQGDNPMQSELCSHIGLGGKFFCRVCQVRGSDKDRGETQESEIGRIADFMKIHELRHVSDTIAQLQSQEETALRGALSSIDDEARKTGVKDKYLIAFMALLKEQRDAHRPALSRAAGVEFVQKLRQTFPKDLYNPALFLSDPNQDTPVEILHVILLGIAKYFWRDAVARQGQDGRETLKARINGLNLEGLGLSAPHGATLVQYAKSLTGGDFRVIMQIAPIVLYDLVPARVYAAWLALSHLAPLAFQSEINDIDTYIPRLSESIDALLQATVAWNPQWFNKPKFHILLHLPEHIRRFGPAVLFATETFESYNFVIRLRSIHSNRRAPSHDIGWAFCRLQAIRFLVSGGWVTHQVDPVTEKIVPSAPRQAGSSVLELQRDPLFMQLMGMSFLFSKRSHGSFKLVPAAGTVAWGDTIASQSESLAGTFEGLTLAACETVNLANHDTVHVNGFVLIQTVPEAQPCPAKVLEIWVTADSGSLAGLTVQIGSIVSHSNIYGMPAVRFDGGNLFICLEMVSCAISLFHNCAEYSCSISRTKIVMQERQETLLRAQEVQHSGDLFDLIINVASLRSATAIQSLRERPRLVEESIDAIARAAVVEWDKEKDEAKAEQERKEKEKEEKKAEQQRKKEERERKKAEKQARAQEDALRGVKPKQTRKRKRKNGDSGKDNGLPPVS